MINDKNRASYNFYYNQTMRYGSQATLQDENIHGNYLTISEFKFLKNKCI